MKKSIAILLFNSLLLFSLSSQLNEVRTELYNYISVDADDIVFIGNSITYGGQWAEIFPEIKVKNRGISGNTTKMILERLSAVTEGKPQKIFLLNGVNDIATATNVEPILQNISGIIEQIKRESPSTQIYIQSVLPVNSSFPKFAHNSRGELIEELNQKLQELCEKKSITYVDVYSHLINSPTDKNLNPLYTNDGLHLLGEGYSKWAEVIKLYLGTETVGINKGLDYVENNKISTFGNQLLSQYSALIGSPDDIIFFGGNTVSFADWGELLNNPRVKSRGVPTNLDELCKLIPGILKGSPASLFLYAGDFDLFSNKSTPAWVRDKIIQITDSITKISPNTRIYIQSLLPRTTSAETEIVKTTNNLLQDFCNSTNNIYYINIFDSFTNLNDDNLNLYYAYNNSVINAKGYILWANQLAKTFGDEFQPVKMVNSVPKAAYYDTLIESEADSPKWFFIQSATNQSIIVQDEYTGLLKAVSTPLLENSDYHFWKFVKKENSYSIQNKASNSYITADGKLSGIPYWFNVNSSISPYYVLKGSEGWIEISEQNNVEITADSTVSNYFSFVKAPIASTIESKTWYQVKNERTAGIGGTLKLMEGDYLNVTTSLTSPNYSDERMFWSFVWNDTNKAYNIENKAAPNRFIPDAPSGSSTVLYNLNYPVSTENPLSVIISPISNGKCFIYKKGTLSSSLPHYATRFDFGSAGTGLFYRALDVVNGRYDFEEFDIRKQLAQLIKQAMLNLDLAEEGKYYYQYPSGAIKKYEETVLYAKELLDNSVDTSEFETLISLLKNAENNFVKNGPYLFNAPGKYALQYVGFSAPKMRNRFVGNTLIDNRIELENRPQLFENYSPKYCDWIINETTNNMFSFVNNREGLYQTGGDFIDNLLFVNPQSKFSNTSIDDMSFRIWMDGPEFQDGVTKIAIEMGNAPNRFWTSYSGATPAEEKLGYRSNNRYEDNNFFRLHNKSGTSSVEFIETQSTPFFIKDKKIFFYDNTKDYNIFNVLGKKIDDAKDLNTGVYIVTVEKKSFKIIIN